MLDPDFFGELGLEAIDVRTDRGHPIGGEGLLNVVLFPPAHVRSREIDPLRLDGERRCWETSNHDGVFRIARAAKRGWSPRRLGFFNVQGTSRYPEQLGVFLIERLPDRLRTKIALDSL